MKEVETIEFYRKNVYGTDHMYVADKEIARAIQTLTQAKTLLESSKRALESLGFSFIEVIAPRV